MTTSRSFASAMLMELRGIFTALAVVLPFCFGSPLDAAIVGGTLRSNTVWAAGSQINVTSPVTVASDVTLKIEAGALVRLGRSVSIIVQAGGAIEAAGTAANPILFRSLDGTNNWGRLSVEGANASLTLRHTDLEHGRVAVLEGSRGLFEFCSLHDFHVPSGPGAFDQPILTTTRAASLIVRACHFRNYYETLFQSGVIVVEDSLFEDVTGDGIDFDTASPGSVIRRCTIRRGTLTNVDAVDLGSGSIGVTVENCLIHDFPADKGISIGERSTGITVRNCVIYGVDIGVAVKDSSVADLVNNTIADSANGLSLYEKITGQGGGTATAWNNILWNNVKSVSVDERSTITVTHSNVSGAELHPGVNNLNADPAFRNAAAHDYRLGPESPVIRAAADGKMMGAQFPVGSSLVDTDRDRLPDPWEMAHELEFNDPSDASADLDGDGWNNLQEFLAGTNPRDAASVLRVGVRREGNGELALGFTAFADRSYRIESRDSLATGDWQTLGSIEPSSADRTLRWPVSLGPTARFFRIISNPADD